MSGLPVRLAAQTCVIGIGMMLLRGSRVTEQKQITQQRTWHAGTIGDSIVLVADAAGVGAAAGLAVGNIARCKAMQTLV